MNHEVAALHYLARCGDIPHDVAERQLNSYLAAANADTAVCPGLKPRWLLLPIVDTPHHSILPDLGNVIHNILAKTPLPTALSFVLEQSLPSLRHTQRTCAFRDSQDVLLNLVLALLLGLYCGPTVKRPDFVVRSRVYASIHGLLTSTRGTQTAFCLANQPLLVVACMEYVARIVQVHMSPQAAFLTNRDASSNLFFRRIPVLCDELRQDIRIVRGRVQWKHLRVACLGLVDKVSRIKKAGSSIPMRDPFHTSAGALPSPASLSVVDHWQAPKLNSQSPGEYRLLAEALSLNEPLLRIIQHNVQLYKLPANLQQKQVAALAEKGVGNIRAAYLSSRLAVCAHCVVAGRGVEHTRLRLNTLTDQLMCTDCGRSELLFIDMLGHVLRHKQIFFVLCPSCTSVHPYKGEQMWSSSPCSHRTSHRRQKPAPKARHPCVICSELTANAPVERVDHLSGEMRGFTFCQRHMPRLDALRDCTNARQLESRWG